MLKKLKRLISYSLLLVCASALASQSTIDQLEQVLQHSPKTFVTEAEKNLTSSLSVDSQLTILVMLIDKLQQEAKFEQADKHNKTLLQLAEQNNQPSYLAHYWLFKSVPEPAQRENSKKLEYINKALLIAHQSMHNPTLQKSYNFKGAYHRMRSEYEAAIGSFKLALDYSSTDSNKAGNLNQLATIAKNQQLYAQALDYLNKALHLYSVNKDENGIANTLYSLASTNNKLGNYQLAAKQYAESNSIDKSLGNKHNQIYSAIRLCNTYALLKQFDQALLACNEGRTLSLELKTNNIPWANNTLATVYTMQENFGKIVPLMQQNIEEFSDNMSPWVHTRTYQFLSRALSHLEQHQQAEQAANKAHELATTHKLTSLIESNHSELAQLFKRANNYQRAFEHLMQFQTLQSERKSNKEQQRIDDLKNNIAFINKEREVEQQRLAKAQAQAALVEKQNQLLFIMSIVVIIVIASGALHYSIRQKNKLAETEKALLAEYLAKKKQLLADVSHELRTPITGIKLQIESLQLNLEEDVQVSYSVIQDKLNSLNVLINDVYQLAQIDASNLSLNLEKICINELLNSMYDNFASQTELSGLSFSYQDISDNNVHLNLDPERIEQILTNLINNSCLYTDAPGQVLLNLSSSATELQIILEDSSPNVSEQNIPHLFERLYRVESSRSRATGGSGLGLAICKALIEEQNGQIEANQSSLGGLKITISFPL